MTILEMMRELEDAGDLTIWEETTEDGEPWYDVTVEDFEGFAADWSEVDRKIKREDLLDAFLETLTKQAIMEEGNFYHTYYFEGYTIHLGYASYDI